MCARRADTCTCTCVVLLQIVAAVREGRRVWDNLRKILLFNLPVNFAQGGSICECCDSEQH
jgi:magnesium-transporting ATPase (P-type)